MHFFCFRPQKQGSGNSAPLGFMVFRESVRLMPGPDRRNGRRLRTALPLPWRASSSYLIIFAIAFLPQRCTYSVRLARLSDNATVSRHIITLRVRVLKSRLALSREECQLQNAVLFAFLFFKLFSICEKAHKISENKKN